ncbi:MAG: ChaN family lipoprotein, partial [bacterium]
GYQPGDIIKTGSQKIIPGKQFYQALASGDVIYVGESHGNIHSHKVQARIIKVLHQQRPGLSIGFELFRENQQSLLNDWRKGNISAETFRARLREKGSERIYDYYSTVLNFARNQDIPLVALKPARKAVDKIRKNSSKTSDRPDNSNSEDPQELFLRETFRNHVPTGRGFQSYFNVQKFWEQQMAENIHTALSRKNKSSRMIVLTGNYHIIYDFGIPKKLEPLGQYSQRSVMTVSVDKKLSDTLDLPASVNSGSVKPADYVWWIPARESSRSHREN